MQDARPFFESVIESCIECGLCARFQEQSGCWVNNYADLARAMLDGIAEGDFEALADPIWSCTLCGACTARCPAGIDAYEVVFRARCVLNPEQPSIVKGFSPMRTDIEPNSFTLLRELRGTAYPDALRVGGTCKRLFFPGCSLGTYAPELTEAVYRHLSDNGYADGITYGCCGNSFYFMGDPELMEKSGSSLAAQLERLGTTEIVTACASCHAALSGYREQGYIDDSIAITALPALLADEGLAVSPQAAKRAGYDSFCLKDVCRDRHDGVFADSVRRLLGELDVRELKHNRRNSQCCGSGGLVPLYDGDMSDDKRWRVLQEFDDTEASCLVTMCVNCSVALRQDGDTNIVHYLELLFEQPIDWIALNRDMAAISRT